MTHDLTPQAAPLLPVFDPLRALAVTTPVARRAPSRQAITRRVFLLGGFWSAVGLAAVGLLGAPASFLWSRNVGGFGGPITIGTDRVPEPGGTPLKIVEGRFFIINREAGEDGSPAGLLALWSKCPHLGCTVPYRADLTFRGSKGWFRCPCHSSTYSRDAGIRVYGPAPRPMDVFPLTVNEDLSVTVQTGRQFEYTGSSENPFRAVPYEPGATTPGIGEAGPTSDEASEAEV